MTRTPDGGAGDSLASRRRAARRAGGEDYESKRRELIHRAAMLFQDKGYQATTLKEVADVTAIDRVSVYRYVSSKEELLREAITECVVEISRETGHIALADLPAPIKIQMILEQGMASYDTHFPLPYIFINEMLDTTWVEDSDWARQLVAMVREIQAYVGEVIRQGIDDGDFRADLPPELVTNAMLGMLNWTNRWYRPGRRHTHETVGRTFTALLLDGLSPR